MEFKEQNVDETSPQVRLLVYDAESRLCVTTKQKLEERGVGEAESDVRFLAYQSEAAKKILTCFQPYSLNAKRLGLFPAVNINFLQNRVHRL